MQVGRIHRAASTSIEPPAVLTVLATVIPCDTYHLAAVRVDDIDRATGDFPITAPDGCHHRVAVGLHGAIALHNAVGGRKEGHLVPDPHGGPLKPDGDTLDYARQLVADAHPSIDFAWSFTSIRECLVDALFERNVPYWIVQAQMGLGSVRLDIEGNEGIVAQRAAIEWLGVRSGLRPISPFEFIDLATIAADALADNERLRRGRRHP